MCWKEDLPGLGVEEGQAEMPWALVLLVKPVAVLGGLGGPYFTKRSLTIKPWGTKA